MGIAPTQQAHDEILRLDREWRKVAGEYDLERMLSYWSDDAVLMPPGMPAIIGKPALREFVGVAFRTPGFSLEWETLHVVVSSSADFAYAIEQNRFTYPAGDGHLLIAHGKGVTVWRKDPDGWKCVVNIWNDDGDAGQLA